ncbi:MAG: arabinose efflux permease family protein [Clostridiaceae bacterium]|nr:arabinose efflux permease family protein [Clostridiaceae bacterium]
MKSIYKNSNLIIYLVGIFVSGIGSKLTTIALSDKVLRLTGNDFNVSLVFMLQSIPILIFGMFAGNVVDKKNKKIAFIIINIIFALTSFTFAFTYNKFIIFSVVLINGIIQAFYIPVGVSLMPLLVHKKYLTEANGLKMSINGIIMIAGYAFAGILISFTGNTIAFILDGLSFIFIAILSIFLRINKVNFISNVYNETNFKKDMIDGWNFIKNNENVKYMFLIDIITNFIISMQTPLTYIFVEKYLGGSILMAKRTGLLFASAGIGTIFGGVILGNFKSRNKLMLLSVSLVFDSMLVIAFSLNRYFPIALFIFGGMGVVGAYNGSILQTVIQEKTPENLLGRVSGFINSIVQPISVVSILIGGICSNLIEVKWIFIFGALLELLTGLYFIRT